MALTGIYGSIGEQEAFATLARVRELGINHIDTAEVYGSGDNERMVGRAIADYRDEVLLATKFNFRQYAQNDRPGLATDAASKLGRRRVTRDRWGPER